LLIEFIVALICRNTAGRLINNQYTAPTCRTISPQRTHKHGVQDRVNLEGVMRLIHVVSATKLNKV